MRKFTWLIIGLIAIIWLAIAAYWTGNGKSSKAKVFPENPTITPTAYPTATPSPSITPESTPSATIEPTTSIKLVSPTISVNYRY